MAQKLPSTVSHASVPPSGNALGCQGLTPAGGPPFSASKEGGPVAVKADGALAASSIEVFEERSVIVSICSSGVLTGEEEEMTRSAAEKICRGSDSKCCDSNHSTGHVHHKRKFRQTMSLVPYLHFRAVFVTRARVSGYERCLALQRLAARCC